MYQYARVILEQIGTSLRADYPGQIVSIHAFGSRARGDHSGDFDSITEEEAQDSLQKAEALLEQIDELRRGITDGR